MACRDCGGHFESEDFLARHSCPTSTGTKGHGFHCKFCVKMFSTNPELQKHMQEHCHGVEKFHCQLCNNNFFGSHDLQRHMEVHHATKKYMCPICRMKFESKHSLECHLQEHTKSTSNTCDTWRGIANSDGVGIAESSVSSGSETLFCNVCGQTFHQEGHLYQHLDGHFQRKSYECDICNSRFSGPFFLEHHMNVHNSARPYVCSQCGTGYRQKDLLMKHFVIHGVPKMDNLTEQLQDASSDEEVMPNDMFTTHHVQEENDTSALIQNRGDEQVGSDEINFSDLLQTCDNEENESIFGPSLPGQDGFTRINHLHEDTLPKSTFQNEKQLQPNRPEENSLPMPVEGEGRILSAANQKFALEPTSNSSIMCKDGRKTFPCDLCSKVFNTKAHCQRHGRIHTGEMPYECRVCRRKFMWRSSFVTHSCLKPCERKGDSNSTTCNISVIDSEKHPSDQQQDCGRKNTPEAIGHSEVFICSVCGENLATEILLQSHMSVHNGPDPGRALSETQMQNDRIDPVEDVALTGTVHAEDNHSTLPVTDTKTNQILHPVNDIVHQKQFQEESKWLIALRSRQSSEHRNTDTTSYSDTVKGKKRKVFVCEVCSKVSLSQNHYLRHQRIHTGEKPFACDRCDRKFMWKSSLDSHKSSHDKKDKHSTKNDVVSVGNCGRSDESLEEQSGWIPAGKEARGVTRAFICLQCGKSFASEPELQRHVSLHEGTECFTELAPKTDSEVAHVSHIASNVVSIQQRKVPRRKHRKNCHTRKFNSTTVERNAVSKPNRRRFVCEYCSKVFKNLSCYQRHLPFHTGEMAYQCNLCDKKFKWSSSLHSHKKSHNRKKADLHTSGNDMLPFSDSGVSGELMQGQIDRIVERNERSDGDKMFMSLECGMNFASDMQLQSHKSIHEDTLSQPRNEMVIKLSGKTGGSVQQRELKRSSRRQKKSNSEETYIPPEKDQMHEQNSEKFVCEVCDKVFHVKQNYRRHKRIHTQEMPYKCHQCDKAFKWRSSLLSHKKAHRKKKSPASSADYVSVIANELTQETIPELNENKESSSTVLKTFVCLQCGKDYASDLELQIHMFIHGDEDYLKMHSGLSMDGTDPGKSSGLMSHTTQHSTASDPSQPRLPKAPESREKCSPEEQNRAASGTDSKHGQKKRNFTCEVCGKSFVSQNHYRRHMRLHTGEMPYECDRCNRKFKWRSSLDSHKKSHDKKDASITDIEYMTFVDSDEDL